MALFKDQPFDSHAGKRLFWKIECDALSASDLRTLASVIGPRLTFGKVYGIPRGGVPLAKALLPYRRKQSKVTLIVDDVFTTGMSMKEARRKIKGKSIGLVVFARAKCPSWIKPIFTLSEWTRD